MLLLRVPLFLAGAGIVIATVLSALRTVVLPRAAATTISRILFMVMRMAFSLAAPPGRSYKQQDSVLALYGPLTLFLMPAIWVVMIAFGFTAMYIALGVSTLEEAFTISGSSLLTLGYDRPDGVPRLTCSFIESALGPAMIALLVSYLPTIYGAFARRETNVTLLESYAGSPPSAVELLLRARRIAGFHSLPDLWRQWAVWFADVEESHTSIPALAHFRSPRSDRSWVAAAGCVLDAASLTLSCVETPRDGTPQLCIRSGFLALRYVGDFFAIPFDAAPEPTDPISVRREEFDAVWEQLKGAGVPLLADQEQAWRDFHGWRVNYDAVLIALAGLTVAPPSLWCGDRALPYRRPTLRRLLLGR